MNHMAPKMVAFSTHLLGGVPRWRVFFFSTFSRTPPLTRLLGDLGLPMVAIWLHFGVLEVHFSRFGHHFGPMWLPFGALWLQKATKISTTGPRRPNQSKNAPKKQHRSKKRTTNTQACKQTQAEPPSRLKWVGGTPEGITISH